LKKALEELGFGPCYHFETILKRPGRAASWVKVWNGEPPDWERIFAGFRSTVDWPAAAFWQELAGHYPQAKVILTVRDPERWYESARATIWRRYPPSKLRTASFAVLGRLLPPLGNLNRLGELVDERIFDRRIEDRAFMVSRFREHTEAVRRSIPPERLLVFEPGGGWGPLCEFLGVESIPTRPFPHRNTSTAWSRSSSAVKVALVASLVAVVWWKRH
jgi:hypothetical protein